jgi:hypothetical protein
MSWGKVLSFLLLLGLAGLAGWVWRSSARTGLAPAATPGAEPVGAARAPVVVELFTSEGCSSCPPADEVLESLEKAQPIVEAEVIPLSLHVDYWNYIGWADPFSSAAFSERQNGYARVFARGQVYTPQMVVDGRAEFVGSREGQAREAIREASRQPKAAVSLQKTGKDAAFSVKISGMPAVSAGDTAEVVFAVTESGLLSNVSRGENAGRRLTHTAVVRSLETIGEVSGKEFQATRSPALDKSWRQANLRVVALVQERRSRRILGAATAPLN